MYSNFYYTGRRFAGCDGALTKDFLCSQAANAWDVAISTQQRGKIILYWYS